jgi:hypothetical protein
MGCEARIPVAFTGIAMSGPDTEEGGTRMRKFLLMVGALIVLALGSLEVIVAHNLEVTEELSAPGDTPWR